MINVVRERAVPVSLNTQDIKDYIKKTQDHLADPENVPKPPVIESYRSSDLLQAFDRCFHQKCYLTEQWFPNSWCMDVEHFIGQAEDPTKVYDWTNLYPADHKYNNLKPRKNPPGGYLDPCNPVDNVETEILYHTGVYSQQLSFTPANTANVKAVNTCNLLEKLHNGHNANTQQATAQIRHEIFKKYNLIQELIIEWLAAPINTPKKHHYAIQLKAHLSRKASFTMLVRSMLSVINHIPTDFLD